MVLHFFRGNSHYNQREVYGDQLSGHPNVRFVDEDGAHLAAARLSAVRSLVHTAAHGLDLIDQNTSPSDLSEALSYPLLEPSA